MAGSTKMVGHAMTESTKVSARAAENSTVVLRGVIVALASPVGEEFVRDCVSHSEGGLSESDLKAKYGLTDEGFATLASNASLITAIRLDRERRVLSGEAQREAARRQFAKAPAVLGTILSDENMSPRNRIEAARELRQAAAVEETGGAEKEPVHIYINLGEGKVIDQKVQFVPLDRAEDDGDVL
jgi:hypothetical protein